MPDGNPTPLISKSPSAGVSQTLIKHKNVNIKQCFGSGSGLDPDSIRSVDPDPDTYSESGSGEGGQKLPRKVEKIKKFHVLKCWFFSFES